MQGECALEKSLELIGLVPASFACSPATDPHYDALRSPILGFLDNATRGTLWLFFAGTSLRLSDGDDHHVHRAGRGLELDLLFPVPTLPGLHLRRRRLSNRKTSSLAQLPAWSTANGRRVPELQIANRKSEIPNLLFPSAKPSPWLPA